MLLRSMLRERFLEKLEGVTDPETKRKVIGNEFIAVFDDEAAKIFKAEKSAGEEIAWLVQGTLYPDVIESSSVHGPSHTIKSHHNVGGLPADMKLKLIEPLRDLFKDEVRRIGRDLGMPEEILERQPFPGPGLGGADSGRGYCGAGGDSAGGRCDCGGGDQAGWVVSQGLAEFCGAAAGEVGWGDGGSEDVCEYLRDSGGGERGWHDGGLGCAAL